MEKRDLKRTDKRLFVKFGKDHPEKIGFTGDISSSGIFIKTNSVFNPGTSLMMELTLPDKKILKMQGKVMWAKKVPPSLHRFTKKSGMGVLIQHPPAEYTAFIAGLK
ncbi:MAG TPA: PilZ domain-containing protein [Nitrospiria bacterium]|nr:PilZ domain-containing protein [Nitrospiria bacterium]